MKIIKTKHMVLVAISLLLILPQCSKYKEKVPFFDGLYLEYHSKGSIYKYDISKIGKKFKINMVKESSVLKDRKKEFIVNGHGIRQGQGEFSLIWISVNELEVGDTFDGGFTVARLDNWKDWEVMVVKAPMGNQKIFYEVNTGFLVGWTGRSVSGLTELVLVDTNADIPTLSSE